MELKELKDKLKEMHSLASQSKTSFMMDGIKYSNSGLLESEEYGWGIIKLWETDGNNIIVCLTDIDVLTESIESSLSYLRSRGFSNFLSKEVSTAERSEKMAKIASLQQQIKELEDTL